MEYLAFFLLACLVLSCHGGGVEGRTLSAVWRGPWQHEIVEGVHPEAAVTATFTNRINQTGLVDTKMLHLYRYIHDCAKFYCVGGEKIKIVLSPTCSVPSCKIIHTFIEKKTTQNKILKESPYRLLKPLVAAHFGYHVPASCTSLPTI